MNQAMNNTNIRLTKKKEEFDAEAQNGQPDNSASYDTFYNSLWETKFRINTATRILMSHQILMLVCLIFILKHGSRLRVLYHRRCYSKKRLEYLLLHNKIEKKTPMFFSPIPFFDVSDYNFDRHLSQFFFQLSQIEVIHTHPRVNWRQSRDKELHSWNKKNRKLSSTFFPFK